MKFRILRFFLAAAALLAFAGATLAADAKQAPAEKPKAAAKVKLVDLNSAKKAELKTLPGISDAEADKIIAGRPYLSKANLVSRNIIPEGTYHRLKALVIAKQKSNSPPAAAKK